MSPTTIPVAGSHFISLARGIEMTSLYRANRELMLAPAFQDKGTLPICETFNRVDIDTLLAKEECKAVRVYCGMDEALKVRVLLVAVNEEGEDILPEESSALSKSNNTNETDDDDEDIVEEGHRCPDTCPPPSPLNEP
jgi:hypothetical protein